MKNNYPQVRKKRSAEYAKSIYLINNLGFERFNEVLSRKGMYLASDEITSELGQYISPYVIRYVRNKIGKGELKNEKTAS